MIVIHETGWTNGLTVENPISVSKALRDFQLLKGDFADHLIREHARRAGCVMMATFDNALLRQPCFVEL